MKPLLGGKLFGMAGREAFAYFLAVANFMKYLITLLFFATGVSSAFATELPINNAGFVQSNIWYSKDPFFAGDKIRIYTIIFNASTHDLSGTVEFLDNGALIGKTTFTISGSVRTKDLWVDWKATEGKHTITAHLIDVVTTASTDKRVVALVNDETGKSVRMVELDPVTKEAQMKVEAEKVAEARAQTREKVEDTARVVNDAIPVPIKEGISFSVDTLEAFRIEKAYNMRLSRENKVKEIKVIKANEQTGVATETPKTIAGVTDAMLSTVEKPFAYVILAILTILQTIFEWTILFYGIIFYAVYLLVRAIVRQFRD